MGDIGLGRDFNLLRSGEEHWAFTLLAGWTKALGMRFPPWLVALLRSVPGGRKAVRRFDDFCAGTLDAVMKSENKDRKSSILAVMLSQAGPRPGWEEIMHLRSDCRSIIFAGSDTSASTLTFAFYYLAKYPEHVGKLREELEPLRGKDGRFKHERIQTARHLNAVINEVLRLHPPGSIIPRETPPEGIKVGDTFVPGNMTVIGSQYVLGRLEEVYVRAGEFVPERWYEEPELVKDKGPYAPFNIGELSPFSSLFRLRTGACFWLWKNKADFVQRHSLLCWKSACADGVSNADCGVHHEIRRLFPPWISRGGVC
jgi:tryprostatin B 6-hydroxylase